MTHYDLKGDDASVRLTNVVALRRRSLRSLGIALHAIAKRERVVILAEHRSPKFLNRTDSRL